MFSPEESLAEQEWLMSELGPQSEVFNRAEIAGREDAYTKRRRLTDLRLQFSQWLTDQTPEIQCSIDWKATPNASRYFGR